MVVEADFDMADTNGSKVEATDEQNTEKGESKRRDIGGNIPYTFSIGVFERALKNLIESERPENFSRDFMATVLNVSGGASAPIIPILKKAEFIDGGSRPTQLYEQFQSGSGRAAAALAGMRNAFDDIFKRNTYAHKADAEKIKEIIRSVTGLPKNDKIIGYMWNTFRAFQVYAKDASESNDNIDPIDTSAHVDHKSDKVIVRGSSGIGLSYNINITLPNTTNIEVYNSIFKSLRENILDGK